MASGTPVIASKIDATIEILKDNAFLLDLTDKDQWLNKIILLINDESIYNQAIHKGIYYSLNFKKGNTVNQILDIYKKI
jgi:glycosyltransferase involved in cell wall biosynthesis